MKPLRTNRPQRMTEHNGKSFEIRAALPMALSQLRSSFVMLFLFIAFVGLMVRAFWLQALSKEFLNKQGEARYARTIELPALRGKVVDRNGVVLATSLPSKSIWAAPDEMDDVTDAQIRALAKLLDMSVAELHRKLAASKSFVYLKRQVEQDIVDQVEKLHIDGVETRRDYKRHYPQGETTAHLIGFTNVEDVGQDGMELALQKTLAGHEGQRRVIRDRLGRVIQDIGLVRPPVNGRDVTMTIDNNIQYLAYTKLKEAVDKFGAKAGGAVVADAKTGEILALVSLPTYDPNNRSLMTGAQLRNRVMTDNFEPGSTLKPFSIALALDEHKITPNSTWQTSPGKMKIGTAVIGDSHAHGILTTTQVIEKSSNIGTAKIALGLEPEAMWTNLSKAGFGHRPELGFPGAVPGLVRPWQKWRPIEQATIAYGQGISVSLVQLVQAYTIFARDGDLMPLSVVKDDKPRAPRRVLAEDTAKTMRNMLETVISAEGTAPKAAVPGYRAGGKTGTAYKVEHGRYVHKYVASFVGIAPISNPKLIVAVMVDEPSIGGHFGGDVAGPVFSDVMGVSLRALKVPFDAEIVEQSLDEKSKKKK